MCTKFWFWKPKGKIQLGKQGMNRKIMLKWILGKQSLGCIDLAQD